MYMMRPWLLDWGVNCRLMFTMCWANPTTMTTTYELPAASTTASWSRPDGGLILTMTLASRYVVSFISYARKPLSHSMACLEMCSNGVDKSLLVV